MRISLTTMLAVTILLAVSTACVSKKKKSAMPETDRTYKLHFRWNGGRRFRAHNPGYDKFLDAAGGR